MSSIIPFVPRTDRVRDEPITEEDLECTTQELQIYLKQAAITADKLNAVTEELEQATRKKERGGWLWFLLGALIGVSI